MTPNQSRRHHSPKGNRWCVDDELLALVLIEWKATWGRLEIKILEVGFEYLGLNT